MAIERFLAAVPAEIRENPGNISRLAYMGCHFSPYGRGLSGLPGALPPGSILMLDDRTPIRGHDPQLVCEQLAKVVDTLDCQAVLLDFQRPVTVEAAAMAQALVSSLPCPVAVSAPYATGRLSCPVCLPPVPCHVSVKDHLTPWQGREIWLELSTEGEDILMTSGGSEILPLSIAPGEGFADPTLHCHYTLTLSEEQARFSLWRTWEDLADLEKEAETLGVTKVLGLWQELCQRS